MWANNETGVIFPIAEMARMARERGILFHTDAVQAVGKIPINLKELDVDFLSLSGHKLHGPKGIGVLYIRRGTPFVPFLVGGHQEKGRRGGTENVASIVGLGRACDMAAAHMVEENSRVKALQGQAGAGAAAVHPPFHAQRSQDRPVAQYHQYQLRVCGRARPFCCTWINITSAPHPAPPAPPDRLNLPMSCGPWGSRLPRPMAPFAILCSIYNTEAEIDFVLEKMPPIIAGLRQMSPFWKADM